MGFKFFKGLRKIRRQYIQTSQSHDAALSINNHTYSTEGLLPNHLNISGNLDSNNDHQFTSTVDTTIDMAAGVSSTGLSLESEGVPFNESSENDKVDYIVGPKQADDSLKPPNVNSRCGSSSGRRISRSTGRNHVLSAHDDPANYSHVKYHTSANGDGSFNENNTNDTDGMKFKDLKLNDDEGRICIWDVNCPKPTVDPYVNADEGNHEEKTDIDSLPSQHNQQQQVRSQFQEITNTTSPPTSDENNDVLIIINQNFSTEDLNLGHKGQNLVVTDEVVRETSEDSLTGTSHNAVMRETVRTLQKDHEESQKSLKTLNNSDSLKKKRTNYMKEVNKARLSGVNGKKLQRQRPQPHGHSKNVPEQLTKKKHGAYPKEEITENIRGRQKCMHEDIIDDDASSYSEYCDDENDGPNVYCQYDTTDSKCLGEEFIEESTRMSDDNSVGDVIDDGGIFSLFCGFDSNLNFCKERIDERSFVTPNSSVASQGLEEEEEENRSGLTSRSSGDTCEDSVTFYDELELIYENKEERKEVRPQDAPPIFESVINAGARNGNSKRVQSRSILKKRFREPLGFLSDGNSKEKGIHQDRELKNQVRDPQRYRSNGKNSFVDKPSRMMNDGPNDQLQALKKLALTNLVHENEKSSVDKINDLSYDDDATASVSNDSNVNGGHLDDRQLDIYCKNHGSVDNLILRQYSTVPPPKMPDHLLIKVEASTVTSRDCLLRMHGDSYAQPRPSVPGFHVVGEVYSLGDRITSMGLFRRGDRVAALTKGFGNAKYVSIPVSDAMLLPSTAIHQDFICLLSTYMTAYQALKLAKNKKGGAPLTNANVLISGGSDPVGQALIDLASREGAKVFTTAPQMHKEHLTKNLGAEWFPDDNKMWLPTLEGLMDVVIDSHCVDGYDSSYKALAPDGVLVCTGHSSGTSDSKSYHLLWSEFKAKNLWSRCVFYDEHESYSKDPKIFQQELLYLYLQLEKGEIKPKVAGRVSLNQVPKAQKLIEKGLPNGTVICLPWKTFDPKQNVKMERIP